MHAVARSYFTNGIAVLGAGAIALAPVALSPTATPTALVPTVLSKSITLTGASGPTSLWLQVIETSATNLSAISNQLFSAPAPILEKVTTNQLANVEYLATTGQELWAGLKPALQALPAQVQAALQQLADGNITGALDTLGAAVMAPLLNVVFYVPQLFQVVTNTAQNFANVVAAIPEAVIIPALTLAYPLVSGLNATAEVAQGVVDAAKAGDLKGVVGALVDAPANIVDGVLNGAGMLLGLFPTPGLLTPYDPVMGFLGSGPIAMALQVRQMIADVLKPVAAAPVASARAVSIPSAAAAAPQPATSETISGDVAKSAATGSSKTQSSRRTAAAEPGVGRVRAHSSSDSAGGARGTKARAATGGDAKSGAARRSAAR